jgi:hypothetical protein
MKIIATTLTAAALLFALNTQAEEKPTSQPRKTIQQNLLNKYDANKNGVLDPEEKEMMRKAREDRRAADLQKLDTNKDGKISRAERAAGKQTVSKKKNSTAS